MPKHFRYFTNTVTVFKLWNDAKNKWDLVWFWRFAGNLTTSLQLANCSMFVPRRRETLGRRQWTVVSWVQCRGRRWPQALSTGNPVDRLNGVKVHGRTGKPWREAWRICVAAHEASAGGGVAEWYNHSDLSGRQVEPLHSWQPAGGPVETMQCRPA